MTNSQTSGSVEISDISGMGEVFSFSLQLEIESRSQLWQAAALECMKQPGMTIEDLTDLIGPMEDPSLTDCIMMLALRTQVEGCRRLDAALTALETLTPAMNSPHELQHDGMPAIAKLDIVPRYAIARPI